MAQTGRPGISAEQKKELWHRWKAEETLNEIGCALGKHAASVFGVVIAKGGIAPPVRCRKPGSLRAIEREEISRGLAGGLSYRQLGRAPSTISREVGRNGGRKKYRAKSGEDRASDRARRPKLCLLASTPALQKLVAQQLSSQWSPQQIAG